MSYLKEFEDILAAYDKLYLFGAGQVATRLYELIVDHDGNAERIQGIVVSKNEYLDSACIKHDNMYVLDDIENLDIPFFVTVNRVYHPEVFELLQNKGAKIIEGHKFFMLEKNYTQAVVNNLSKILALSEVEKAGLTDKELTCREKIIQLRIGNSQAFGEDGFYQSFPRLRLNGMRPTDKRIEKYGLAEYLSKEADVLDIGSNAGFLDMEIAPKCKSVLGVEYNAKLVDVANTAKDILKISNAQFICDDYSNWKKENKRRFNVIFSFAVHVWLGVLPEVYAENICSLLENDGIFLFESHVLQTDKYYDAYCNSFKNQGLVEIAAGYIMDDGVTERKYTIFRKG